MGEISRGIKGMRLSGFTFNAGHLEFIAELHAYVAKNGKRAATAGITAAAFTYRAARHRRMQFNNAF